jgi:small-conductance mechanosensitive channel
MSDQAIEQSQELSIEDRFQNLLEPEQEEEPQQQDNEEEATEAEEVETQEGEEPDEQVEAEEEEAEPDLVEIEVDGESYKVPEALKDKIMLQADYTRKTQEVAEQRKAVEQAQAQLQVQAQLQQQSLAEYARLTAINDQLQQYNQVDWNALYDSDPAEFVRLKEGRRDLIDQYNGLNNAIAQQQQQQIAKQQEITLQAIQEGQKVLAREIPSWNTDLAKTLNTFAVEKFGFTKDEVNAVIDPRVVKLLHTAYLYNKQVSNKPITDKRVANLPKVSKPGSKNTQANIATSREQDARKALKKSGSIDAAQAVFLARYTK